MSSSRRIAMPLYWAATAAAFIPALVLLSIATPVDPAFGPAQKIFYLHLPSALNTFLAAFMVFAASVGYLWQRNTRCDDLAAAAGKVTVLFCLVVLVTGMAWARSEWGKWWTWSPRLTFSLVLLLLYVGYVVLRRMIGSPDRRAVICAVYGIAAFVDVPVVYLSVKLMPDIHPSSIALDPAMKLTLVAWFVPLTMLMAGMVHRQFGINMRLRPPDRSDEGRLSGMTTASPIGKAT